ncbi:hypothetical protein JCM19239_5172 [Vibrio variabilis]|uniref:Uncharacterized protein n=1 Tax=Vibrio variabilis TaxID=990271 RepID=A0ABQ0J997_9VIBR|nr:hypothetical protein JCM19239_5172 [Vibrio variabilis]
MKQAVFIRALVFESGCLCLLAFRHDKVRQAFVLTALVKVEVLNTVLIP